MKTVKVLCLHRISNDHSYSWPPITPLVFEKLINYVSNNYECCLPNHLHENNKIQKPLIITFDDGYEDFYLHALPILEKYSVPAILHIVGKSADEGYPIWTQRLNNIIDTYIGNNQNITISFKEEKTWFISTHNKEKIALSIFKELLQYKESYRNMIIDTIEHNCKSTIKKTPLMTWEQIRDASKRGIEIGSHSMTHPNLSTDNIDKDKLEFEFFESKKLIERNIQKEISSCAFPNGFYTKESLQYAISIGYKNIFLVNEKSSKFVSFNYPLIFNRISIYSNSHIKNLLRLYLK